MGQHHARVLANLHGATLVAVADADVARARAATAQYDVDVLASADELLGRVDAVVIAAPTSCHFELARRCIERGVHVLVENPLAASRAEAQALCEMADSSAVVLQVGHIERFNPTYPQLENVLRHEQPVAFAAVRLSPHTARAADVSVVLDLMIHDLDLVLSLNESPVTAISATGCRAKSPTLDHAVAMLTFANGTTATLTASKIAQHKVRGIAVVCRESFVEGDFLHRTVRIHRASVSSYDATGGQLTYRQEGVVENVLVPVVEPLHAELQHFVACVRERKTPLVTAGVGKRVLDLALEIEGLAERSVRPG
ncbi:MAG: Gfo/Idh/MocA family oxidoreductase [Actinobacteria bacterium]|nr:Gfo/Idh/MocA family oxidoreductase [Actinomycetota bacterium]